MVDTGKSSDYTENVARQTAGFYQRDNTHERALGAAFLCIGEGRAKESIMAKDGPRIIVKMESSAGTGFYYTTTKNRRNTQAKLELKKYDPVAKKHVVFKEKKV